MPTPTTGTIAVRCGYGNANVLRNLFKRTFSVSLRGYRKTQKPTP